jgi:tellurite resistance protein
MSLSFNITSTQEKVPTFNAIVAIASMDEPVQLAGAGWTGDAWPKGLFAKIVDAASAPSKLEMTPELEASFARVGVSGSFIAYTRGAARGVIVAREIREGNTSISLHVPVLASSADYLLAARLAAAAARLVETNVSLDDPNAPEGVVKSLPPDAILAQWTEAAADAHARQVGTWLADDIAQGRTYFFQGPRGFVALGPTELGSITESGERFARARAILVGEEAGRRRQAGGQAQLSADGRREAVLLTAAMVFAAGADGVLADEEARQLEAQFATVKELRAFPPRELLDAVRAEVTGIDALGELGSESLRRKAFILASEVIASARDGKLGGDEADPNVQAVSAIAKALVLDGDQIFLAQVVRTVMAKYEDSKGDDDLASLLAVSMLITAAADGVIDDREAAVLSALARTVPELRTRDVSSLFEAAKARMSVGPEIVLDDLAAMSASCKNKCFALATEVALIAGKGPEGTMLPRLLAKLAPDRDYADAAIATFAAKYV